MDVTVRVLVPEKSDDEVVEKKVTIVVLNFNNQAIFTFSVLQMHTL